MSKKKIQRSWTSLSLKRRANETVSRVATSRLLSTSFPNHETASCMILNYYKRKQGSSPIWTEEGLIAFDRIIEEVAKITRCFFQERLPYFPSN
jgi:hypothetical protein